MVVDPKYSAFSFGDWTSQPLIIWNYDDWCLGIHIIHHIHSFSQKTLFSPLSWLEEKHGFGTVYTFKHKRLQLRCFVINILWGLKSPKLHDAQFPTPQKRTISLRIFFGGGSLLISANFNTHTFVQNEPPQQILTKNQGFHVWRMSLLDLFISRSSWNFTSLTHFWPWNTRKTLNGLFFPH